MNTLSRHCLFLFAALLAGVFSVEAQDRPDPKDLVAPTFPEWVKEVQVNLDVPPDVTDEAGSEYFLLGDRQYDVETRHHFRHYIKRFNTENGVQDGSQLEFSFDPSYQKLFIHRLRLHRDGEVIDLLPTQEFKLIQREEDHERQLYDSSLSALAVIEDTRVGDLLEYSYSTQGSNPVFGDHFYWSMTLGYTIPVGIITGSIRLPEDTFHRWHAHETEVEPDISTADGYRTYHWSLENPPALINEGALPADYDPWGWAEVSSYEGWDSVIAWALDKYRPPDTLPAELEDEIARLRELDSPEKQVQSALRFVQDEIRYLGLFEGIHTHQPYPVETILNRRFGDCKDKSLMLTTMLRSLGFDASPALVHTDFCKAIKEWLPSPQAFNHLVVALNHEGTTYWLDATRSYQRGKLEDLYFPDYGYALIIKDDTTDLARIGEQGYAATATRIEETFTLEDYSGPVEFQIKTVYSGAEADSTRSYFESTQRNRIARDYLNYYADYYDNIEAVGRPETEDDEVKNTFTVFETYQIPNIWEERERDDSKLDAKFRSKYVYDEIAIPSTKKRKMPYAIDHPVNISHDVTIHLPDPMEEEDVTLEIKDPAFEFHYRERFIGDTAKLHFSYQSTADRVEPDRISEYLENAREAEDNTSYAMWITRDLHEGTATFSQEDPLQNQPLNWAAIITAVLSLVIGLLVSLIFFYWNPVPREPNLSPDRSKGLGGILVIPPLYLCLMPFFLFVALVAALMFSDLETWRNLTHPNASGFHSLWAPLMLLEIGLSAMLMPVYVTVAVLYFLNRTNVPGIMIILLIHVSISSLLLFGLNAACGEEVGFRNAFYPWNFAVTILSTLILVPYFARSSRVAMTFRRNLSGEVLPPPPPRFHSDEVTEANTSPTVATSPSP